jgi:hypothetical protein
MVPESGIGEVRYLGMLTIPRTGEAQALSFFLSDLLLFFCLAAWVTGLVIAVASLLS